MSVVKPEMNSDMNGGSKGPGGPMGGPMRGGRGRGGARGGQSRFSGGPMNTSGDNLSNRPPPTNTSRPPPMNRPPNRSNVKNEVDKDIKSEVSENRGGPGGGSGGNNGPMNRDGPMNRGGPGGGSGGNNGPMNRDGPMNRGGGGGGMNNNQGGGNRGGNRFQRRDDSSRGGGGGNRGQDERLMEKISAMSGPTYDLPNGETTERKFSGHCRLYVGNLTSDITEEEVTALFTPFGQTAELFLNKDKNFAFIRLDYRASAEKAKRELDGSLRKGRQLKVRFAPHTAAIKVKNLTPFVSNELLETAFSVFGEIERAYVVVDDRGKSQGEGIVEFARKPGAQLALRKCQEQCFFLTSSLRPVIAESYEQLVDPDGFPEKNMFKKSPDFLKAREVGPRFASPNSFEHDYGTRWKQLFEQRKQKVEALEREMRMEEEKLEAQMEYARYEHETEMLREQLRQRELDRDRQKLDWERKERQQEEQRRQDEELMRRQQEEMQMRMLRQEEDMRRRQQENSLFMQAHQLNSLLDQQEQAMRSGGGGGAGGAGGYGLDADYDQALPGDGYTSMRGSGGPGNLPVDPKAFMDSYDRVGGAAVGGGGGGGLPQGGRYDAMDDLRGGPGGAQGMGRQRWGGSGGSGGDRRPLVDDYPNKRRRY